MEGGFGCWGEGVSAEEGEVRGRFDGWRGVEVMVFGRMGGLYPAGN